MEWGTSETWWGTGPTRPHSGYATGYSVKIKIRIIANRNDNQFNRNDNQSAQFVFFGDFSDCAGLERSDDCKINLQKSKSGNFAKKTFLPI